MKPSLHWILVASLLGVFSTTQAADSGLRVTCEGGDVGAEVWVNDKFRGECPVDLKVPAGTLRLMVRKQVDAERVRLFEQDIRMGEDSIKKVEAVLVLQLSAEGERREGERVAKQREDALKKAENEKTKQDEFLKLSRDAQAGDARAMEMIGDLYASGNGVKMLNIDAGRWYAQSMAAGNPSALPRLLAVLNRASASELAQISGYLGKDQFRNETIIGLSEVRTFIGSDPFFNVLGGTAPVPQKQGLPDDSDGYDNGNREAYIEASGGSRQYTRNDRFFQTEAESHDGTARFSISAQNALGGLILVERSRNAGFLRVGELRQKLVGLSSLYGQPFPLKVGSAFGLKIKVEVNPIGPTYTMQQKLDCVVTGVSIKDDKRAPGVNLTPMRCALTQGQKEPKVSDLYWHEASGWFIRRDIGVR
jgi:TPR repeat protein